MKDRHHLNKKSAKEQILQNASNKSKEVRMVVLVGHFDTDLTLYAFLIQAVAFKRSGGRGNLGIPMSEYAKFLQMSPKSNIFVDDTNWLSKFCLPTRASKNN